MGPGSLVPHLDSGNCTKAWQLATHWLSHLSECLLQSCKPILLNTHTPLSSYSFTFCGFNYSLLIWSEILNGKF